MAVVSEYQQTKHNQSTCRSICERYGWTVGTRLQGETTGVRFEKRRIIRITAIGDEKILVRVEQWTDDTRHSPWEYQIFLSIDNWKEI